MNILVTGAAGFIGSHLGEKLLKEGYKVIGVDNFDSFYAREIKEKNLEGLRKSPDYTFYQLDLKQKNGFDQIKEQIDAVIHLAAKAGVLPSIKDPQGYLATNVGGTQNLLEFMQQRKINKFLFASSSSVYGNNRKVPFSETDLVDNPISPYAFSKKACELLNYTYHYLYKIDVLNLRFFTVYGPRQRPDLAIHKFFNLIKSDTPIPIYGDGSTARDYTFVKDTVQGIMNALHYLESHSNVYETLNLGNSKPVKLLDLVSAIYTVLNKEPNLIFKPMQPGDVDITFADISKAKKLIGYEPQVTLEEGLRKFNEWLETN